MLETPHNLGVETPLDTARRIVVFVVNSLSSPPTDWDKHERSPGTLNVLLQATGDPIDHYSYEATKLLKDTAARWRDVGATNIISEPAACIPVATAPSARE
jgi:NTE family protein